VLLCAQAHGNASAWPRTAVGLDGEVSLPRAERTGLLRSAGMSAAERKHAVLKPRAHDRPGKAFSFCLRLAATLKRKRHLI